MTDGAPAGTRLQIQGTCVALDGTGILLRGPSGSGKSDLALRLVDAGGLLVTDDLCEIRRDRERLLADLPTGVDARFRGLIEARGVGLLSVPHAGPVPLGLVADLKPGDVLERLPEPAEVRYLGLALPLVVLDPFHASAVAKLRLVARQHSRTIMRPP
jgi:HPr kinase/phosphorylase